MSPVNIAMVACGVVLVLAAFFGEWLYAALGFGNADPGFGPLQWAVLAVGAAAVLVGAGRAIGSSAAARRVPTLIAAGVAIAIAVLALAMLREKTNESLKPKDVAHRCPMVMTVDGWLATGEESAVAPWTVYTHDKHGTAPKISVKSSSAVRPPNRASISCELRIERATGEPLDGIDWRMGYRSAAGGLAGKTVDFRLMLKSDPPITFETARLYIYDGHQITETPIRELDGRWRQFTVRHRIAAGSKTLEAWLRLTLHGRISNTGTVYVADGQLDVK